MQPAYRDVNVRQLLAHSGGVPPYRTRESLQWMLALKGTGTEQRHEFLERVLAEPPRFEAGTSHEVLKRRWCHRRRHRRADRALLIGDSSRS